MLPKNKLVDLIVANLDSNFCFPAIAFLDSLIERQKYDANIPRYRIKDSVTNTRVTSVADFEDKLTIADIKYSYDYNAKFEPDKMGPLLLYPTNFTVELIEGCEEDSLYFSKFGSGSNLDGKMQLIFVLNYLNDADNSLPLKLIAIRLK